MPKPREFLRKVLVSVAGFLLIIIGLILVPLPGPGLAVIALGLFVLSFEFEWADRHYHRLEKEAKKYLDRILRVVKKR